MPRQLVRETSRTTPALIWMAPAIQMRHRHTMSDRDYYEILGLTPGADGVMVDQSYWHLARKYQALAATNHHARRMLDELNEAYGVLGTPRLREQYDAFRDDVLIEAGAIKPIASRPKRPARAERPAPAGRERRPWRMPAMPRLPREHWRTYGIASVIAALALAAAWQGVSPLFVVAAMSVGLALALTPALSRHMPEISISLPAVSIPEIKAPTLSMPKLPDVSIPGYRDGGIGTPKDEPVSAEELHTSTSAMIARWRNSVGLRPLAAIPSTELVDIVQTEREIEADSAPLSAVIDILRNSRRGVESGETRP
jgi:hypothetical protein